jgi:hypothetical protein
MGVVERLRFEPGVDVEQFLIHLCPQRLQRDGRLLALQDALDLVPRQAGQPGKDIVAGARRIVAGEIAQGAQERLLHDFFAPVLILADAVQAKAIQRLKHLVQHRLDGRRVPLKRAKAPGIIEDGLQSLSSFERHSRCVASSAANLCEEG